MSKRKSHIHKYKKVPFGNKGTIVFRCMIPGCSHYLHEEMVRNQKSLCWKCNTIFVMTPDKMRRQKPRCDKCQWASGSGKKKEMQGLSIESLDSLLENL
jgi:hypothetical protein